MNHLFTNRAVISAAFALAVTASTLAGCAGSRNESAGDSYLTAEVETVVTETMESAEVGEPQALGKSSADSEEVVHVHTTIFSKLAFETIYQESESLPEGQERVICAGKDGVAALKAVRTMINGREVSLTKLSQEVTEKPQNKIVLLGTGKIGSAPKFEEITDTVSKKKKKSKKIKAVQEEEVYIPSMAIDNGRTDCPKQISLFSVPEYVQFDQNGIPLNYSEVLYGNSTAYTAEPGALMSTGNAVYQGFVAVDPNVIPYGSELYIVADDGEVYGYAIAGDTGGAARQGRIIADLFFNDYSDCVQWGRKDVTIYVLSGNANDTVQPVAMVEAQQPVVTETAPVQQPVQPEQTEAFPYEIPLDYIAANYQ